MLEKCGGAELNIKRPQMHPRGVLDLEQYTTGQTTFNLHQSRNYQSFHTVCFYSSYVQNEQLTFKKPKYLKLFNSIQCWEKVFKTIIMLHKLWSFIVQMYQKIGDISQKRSIIPQRVRQVDINQLECMWSEFDQFHTHLDKSN
ncbi:Hypothetical_protein [Hexamita inflata]|uniref:Hypothetical_protein n=1 Tax=Hexamita inflata TaxID=28002 RepID=A0AA86NW72_9EUKA|nr:Hypothetical protein HINF_LOCUS13466 [Hexamita inflata]